MGFKVSSENNNSISINVNNNMDNSEKKDRGKTIDARNFILNQKGLSAVEKKKQSVRKQAMQLIADAWGRDNKTELGIKEMQDEKSAKLSRIGELESKLNDIEENKQALVEKYGVNKDSREYKDLELLEKYQDNKKGVSFDRFSKEEIDRLKELQNIPLTEFQKKALELNGIKGEIKVEIRDSKNDLVAMTSGITQAKINQLKSQDMLKSKEAAEQMLDAADKDVMDMLVDEAKEHIDDEAEEAKEKIENVKENQKENQKRIEKSKEKREEQEKIIEGQLESDKLELDYSIQNQNMDRVEEVQKNISKLLNENYLVNEDLKGIEIDLNF